MKKLIIAILAGVMCMSVGASAAVVGSGLNYNTNCNAHRYVLSDDEWQYILNKDDEKTHHCAEIRIVDPYPIYPI